MCCFGGFSLISLWATRGYSLFLSCFLLFSLEFNKYLSNEWLSELKNSSKLLTVSFCHIDESLSGKGPDTSWFYPCLLQHSSETPEQGPNSFPTIVWDYFFSLGLTFQHPLASRVKVALDWAGPSCWHCIAPSRSLPSLQDGTSQALWKCWECCRQLVAQPCPDTEKLHARRQAPFRGVSWPQWLPQLGTVLQAASSRAGGLHGAQWTEHHSWPAPDVASRALPGDFLDAHLLRVCFLLVNSICNCKPAAQSSKEGAETLARVCVAWLAGPSFLPVFHRVFSTLKRFFSSLFIKWKFDGLFHFFCC